MDTYRLLLENKISTDFLESMLVLNCLGTHLAASKRKPALYYGLNQ